MKWITVIRLEIRYMVFIFCDFKPNGLIWVEFHLILYDYEASAS
jgi:hypothetical protein